MKKIVAVVLLTLLGALAFGCVAVSEYITPTPVDKGSVKYAAEAGVVDANSFRGYANLRKARKLAAAVKAAYEINTLAFQQMIDTHELDYGILTEVLSRNTKIGEHREAALFSEKGLLSMGLGLAGMGGLGGLLGLMRKRPGDVTPIELESAVTKAGIDVQDKERQMLEIVAGVSKFMKNYDKMTGPGQALRLSLRESTNSDTKKIVAALQAV